MITQARIRELFDYRSDGELIRRVRTAGRAKIGEVAGYLHSGGYRYISVNSKSYKAHRLVWLWHNGYMPENGIDHIDRNKNNNKIENLREVSKVCNARNCNLSRNNSSGITGVAWLKKKGAWRASISILGKSIHLGLHDNILKAAKTRWDAEVKYEWPSCNSTSSAYLFLREAGEI
jgi:hypothetical protein